MSKEIFDHLSGQNHRENEGSSSADPPGKDKKFHHDDVEDFSLPQPGLSTDQQISNIIFLMEQDRTQALILLEGLYKKHPRNPKVVHLMNTYLPGQVSDDVHRIQDFPSDTQDTQPECDEPSPVASISTDTFLSLNRDSGSVDGSAGTLPARDLETGTDTPQPVLPHAEQDDRSDALLSSIKDAGIAEYKSNSMEAILKDSDPGFSFSPKKVLLVILIAVMAAGGAWQLNIHLNYKNKVQLAQQYMQTQEYETALHTWKELAGDYPSNEWIRKQLENADSLFKKKQTEESAKKITAEAIDFHNRGLYAKAIELFEKALEITPENENLKTMIATSKENKRIVESQQSKHAIRKENEIEELTYKAKIHMENNEWDSAKELWIEVLRLDATNPEALRNIREIDYLKNLYSDPARKNGDASPDSPGKKPSDSTAKGLFYYQQQIGNYTKLAQIARKRLNNVKENLYGDNPTESRKQELEKEEKELISKLEEFHGKIWDLKMQAMNEGIPLTDLQ